MTFFSADPDPVEADEPPDESTPPWFGAPDHELPVLLPAAEVLARTDHAVVALIGALVHREGVELRIERRLRRGGLDRTAWQQLVTAFMEHGAFGEPGDPGARLRFGLVLGDGERVLDSALCDPGGPSAEPQGHTLRRTGGSGGGGGRRYSGSEGLWLWPLPPDGPIELVMQWPALGIDEVRAVLDGTRIRALAAQAAPLWQDD